MRRREEGYERHLINLIIQRGNCFSIIKSLFPSTILGKQFVPGILNIDFQNCVFLKDPFCKSSTKIVFEKLKIKVVYSTYDRYWLSLKKIFRLVHKKIFNIWLKDDLVLLHNNHLNLRMQVENSQWLFWIQKINIDFWSTKIHVTQLFSISSWTSPFNKIKKRV